MRCTTGHFQVDQTVVGMHRFRHSYMIFIENGWPTSLRAVSWRADLQERIAEVRGSHDPVN